MTPVSQVLVPGNVSTPGTVQMAKIAPATTALPTQLTTVLPTSNITTRVPVVQPSATPTKTILPQTSLQHVQTRNVVINPANLQQLQRPGEISEFNSAEYTVVIWPRPGIFSICIYNSFSCCITAMISFFS